MSDSIREYERALREFFLDKQELKHSERRDGMFQSFQLWRIAEALEALADVEAARGIDGLDDDEPWRGDD